MRSRERRGMTFLEVMVVLVILGIMLALTIPSMSGPRARTALRTSARDLAAAGLLARQRAISQGKETYLILNIEDEEPGAWRIHTTPPDEEDSRRKREEMEPTTTEEQPRELPNQVSFAKLKVRDEELDLEEEQRLVFYPNGTCTGMAIELLNNREKSMTVDFDPATGLPSVYTGEPKSIATKLREVGLNPEDYGYVDDSPLTTESGGRAGEGYYTSAGWSEEERVKYYEDAVDRMLQRAQTKKRIAEEGLGAYYSGAGQWGN